MKVKTGCGSASRSHSLRCSSFHIPEMKAEKQLGAPYNNKPSVIFYHRAWLWSPRVILAVITYTVILGSFFLKLYGEPIGRNVQSVGQIPNPESLFVCHQLPVMGFFPRAAFCRSVHNLDPASPVKWLSSLDACTRCLSIKSPNNKDKLAD